MTIAIVTDNGPHPASKMATVCADQIVQHDALDENKHVKAQLLKAQLADALEAHFANVQHNEYEQLINDPDHILTPLSVDPTGAMFEVRKATDASVWAEHFANPDVDAAIRDIVQRHLLTAAHIERLWHSDRNPTLPSVLAFKET